MSDDLDVLARHLVAMDEIDDGILTDFLQLAKQARPTGMVRIELPRVGVGGGELGISQLSSVVPASRGSPTTR
ncbi:MAG: hypothetical protein ACR2G7_07285 [Acidimicrobiales bacterium]